MQKLEREVTLGGRGAPDLPERFARGPRPSSSSAPASSSSTAAPSGLLPSDRSAVKITSANPLLRPKPKAQPQVQYRVQYLDPSPENLRRLQLQIWDGGDTFNGKQAVISWGHHQVLDTFRHSRKRISRAQGGQYPEETQRVLENCHQLAAKLAQIVLSYCHKPETVQNVYQRASRQPEVAKIVVSRKPDGPLGKLAVLRALFSTSTPIVHIDDSADVLKEFRDFIRAHKSVNWRIIGISVPGKPVVEGVPYVCNVKEALETILKRTGLAGSIAALP